MLTGRRTYPRWLVRGLVLFAVGMTAFAAVASREHNGSERARKQALSQYVALESRTLQGSDPSLAMQLALVAYRLWPTMQARSALLDVTAREMPTRLIGRPGQTALALGDNGHRLAIAYRAAAEVKVYALRYSQLTPLATLPVGSRTASFGALAISRSGRLLAIGDSAGTVTLWSLGTPAHPRLLATLHAGPAAVRGLGFSPAGGALAAADADGVQRWSLADPRHPSPAPLLVAPGGAELRGVSYSPRGDALAAVGTRGTLVLWRAHAGAAPLASVRSGTATLTAIAYSPDGHLLAAGGAGGATDLWSLSAAGRPARREAVLRGGGNVNSLAFSRDGRYLAVGGSDWAARIWATSDRRQLASLPHPAAVTGVVFSDGDRRVLSSDAAGDTMVWQFPPPGSHVFQTAVTGLSYSSTDPRLAVTTAAGRTDQWNVVSEWRPAPVGSWYATPLADAPPGSVWSRRTTSTATATTTTGTTATTGTGTTGTTAGAPVINPDAGRLALQRTRAATTVTSSMLSPDGQLFAAAGTDHLVWLWDVSDPASPRLIAKLSGFSRWVTAVVFSGNSQTLFAGSADHTVRLWSLGNPDAPQELQSSPLLGPSSAITAMALSPTGGTLAAATAEGHVWLWSVGNPAKASPTATLTAARGPLGAIAFSPTDNLLVTGGGDRRLTFWHFRPYQAVNRICALAGTPITPAEWQQYVPEASYDPPCARWTPPQAPPAP